MRFFYAGVACIIFALISLGYKYYPPTALCSASAMIFFIVCINENPRREKYS